MSKTPQYLILIPLSLLVIITVLAILAANLGMFGQAAQNSQLAKWGPAGVLAEIIGLYIFVGKVIFSDKKQIKPSLLIGSPTEMPTLDIVDIEWREDKCFILNGDFKENIKFVPSLVGPTLRVHLSERAISFIKKNPDTPLALELEDKKGNNWGTKSFYLTETLQRLTLKEDVDKIIRDYGKEEQE